MNLLAVNVNHPSRYSVLAVDAILAHYGLKDVGVGIRRPITDEHFFDSWYHKLGEYASKVAYNWPAGNLGRVAENAFHPVDLYRKVLSQQKDGSVTIASIGFLENVGASRLCSNPQEDFTDKITELRWLFSSQPC